MTRTYPRREKWLEWAQLAELFGGSMAMGGISWTPEMLRRMADISEMCAPNTYEAGSPQAHKENT